MTVPTPQEEAPKITPLVALIWMLQNELKSIRECCVNRFGWLPIVESTLRIFRTPETNAAGQTTTLVEFFASEGLSKAFGAMYGDAYLHYAQWEMNLKRSTSNTYDPVRENGNVQRGLIAEVYLINIIRFLEEHEESKSDQPTTSEIQMTQEKTDTPSQQLREACTAFIEAHDQMAAAYVDGVNVHGALSAIIGTATSLEHEAQAFVSSFEGRRYEKSPDGILSAAIDATFIRVNDEAPWLRVDTVDTSDCSILAHDENTQAPGDQVIQVDDLDPDQVAFKRLVEFKL